MEGGYVMRDMKLLDTCKRCKGNLTIMESVREHDNQVCLVIRCLNCFEHPLEEVLEVKTK